MVNCIREGLGLCILQRQVVMTPRTPDWLDIHGHFAMPLRCPEDGGAAVLGARYLKFMIDKPYIWNADVVLAFNDRCNIRM